MHNPFSVLIALAIAWTICYWFSLRLHPFVKCKACSGTGRHSGMIFGRASRACGTCGGSSRVPRFGVRVFLNESVMKYRR